MGRFLMNTKQRVTGKSRHVCEAHYDLSTGSIMETWGIPRTIVT